MKKIIYILIFFITIIVGIFAFASSTYFFNKYIAKNIKEYGFNYAKVEGALFQGFVIESLSYKKKELSSNVELKINPLKLVQGLISINKLYLIGVKKDVLENVVNDFKPNDDSSTSTNIDIDFEFKNILLTIKPFVVDSIKVKKSNLSIEKVSYINNRFYVGMLEYESISNIGNINFSGQFKNRTLFIKNIDIKNLDLKRFIKLLTLYKSDKNSNSELLSSPFTPKIVNINSSKLYIKPLKYKDLTVNNLVLNIDNARFNIEKLNLDRAHLGFKYLSNILDVDTDLNYLDKNLTLNHLNIDIKKTNMLEEFINSIFVSDSNNSNSINSIFSIYNINIKKSSITLKDYKYKSNTIDNLNIVLNNSKYNIHNKDIKVDNFLVNLNSDICKLSILGKLKKDLIIKKAKIVSENIDKILFYLKNGSSTDKKNSFKPPFKLPKKIVIKDIKIEGNNAKFTPFVLERGIIQGKNIITTIDKLSVNSGYLEAFVKSPWGVANLKGNIKDNNYFAKGEYKVYQNLLNRYSIPLIAKNIDKLKVQGRFGFESLDINVSLKGKNILKDIKNFDITSSKSRVAYNYIRGDVNWSINSEIDNPYTKIANLNNNLIYTDKNSKLNYYGVLKPKGKFFNSNELQNLFKNIKLKYSGDSNILKVNILSSFIKGKMTTNYKNLSIKLENLNEIKLSNYILLPKELKDSKITNFIVKSKINFSKIFPINGEIGAKSNLFDIDGKWSYNKKFVSSFITTIPKKSLLIKDIKKLQYKSIKKFNTKLIFSKNDLDIELKNSNLFAKFNYLTDKKNLNLLIKSGSINIKTDGKLNNLNCIAKINSINNALNDIKKIYKIDLKSNIDGVLYAKFIIKSLKSLNYKIVSPNIIYKNKESKTVIDNLNISGRYENKKIFIDNYKLKANGYNIFSNKKSIISYENNYFNLKEFWINDSLKLIGLYHIDKKSGEFKLKSNRFKLNSSKANVNLSIDTNIKIFNNKKYIKGLIKIIDGKINKNITKKNIADNEDIIILQRKKEKENTEFAKNVKLNLRIVTDNGIVYSENGSYLKLIPNITIKKDYERLSDFRGFIKVTKDSYYLLNKKRLKIYKGLITFKGKSSSPNINIEMRYKGSDYKIFINISGTPTRPVLFFSSNPPLTKEQILAYLFFDDTSAVGTHNKKAMLNIIGGNLAKSLLNSIGIKIDHISVKENGFSIGKSISKRAIIYYNQDGEKASIKTKVDITKHIHTEIEIGKDKKSADIIFSREY